jgi:hypothetical protein
MVGNPGSWPYCALVTSKPEELDLITGAAFALGPLPLVMQYRPKARKLTIRPSRRIYFQASCPGLNKIPFQLVQLFANHKTNSCLDRTLSGDKKPN